MKLASNALKLCSLALLAFSAGAAPSFAAMPSRVNPAFIKNLPVAVSTSTYRVKTAAVSGAAAAKHPLGWIPSPVNMSHMTGQDVSRALARRAGVSAVTPVGYAASYDLRNYSKLTPVRNQGSDNDCWAYASYASLESNLLPAETWDFSEYYLATNSGFNWTINDGGNSSMSTAYMARWSGPVNEGDSGLTVRKHLQNMFWLPPTSAHGDSTFINNVKSAIVNYGAVYSSIYWDDAASKSNYLTYYNTSCTYPFGHTNSSGNEDDGCSCYTSGCGGHAIALVGWNDSYAASNFATAPPGAGAFLARNSWGTSIGDGGYFYISYYDTSIGAESAVFDVAEATTNYNTIYQYDPLGFTYEMGNADLTGTDSYTEWMANIFTASSTGFIKAAGFYTTDTNVNYNLYVYTFTGNSSTPINGSPVYSASGSFAMSGYHTVTFTSNVPVTSGQKFSVVVKLTNTNNTYQYPIAVEYPLDGYSSAASASAGQSFISNDGSSWTDLGDSSLNPSYYGEYYNQTNVCLKAYAFTDTTGPSAVASVNDGTGADIAKTGSITQLSANWPAASDPETGVSGYYYAIGTVRGGTPDVTGWTSNGTAQAVTKTGLSLTNGTTYYFGVKAVNGVGLYSAETWSDGQYVDHNAPAEVTYVNDGAAGDIDYVSSLNTLSANWGASPSIGVTAYYYAIGTTPGGQEKVAWTSVGLNTAVTNSSLSLSEGTTYYFSVKVLNSAGYYSSVSSSDGQLVDVTSPAARILVSSALPAKPGAFSAKLIVTEANGLPAGPQLSLKTSGGYSVPLTVSYLTGSTWTVAASMETYYSSGTVTFHFSGTDPAGNVGTSITSGGTFTLDTSVSGVSGGSVANDDGMAVTVPAGAYAGTLFVHISTVAASRFSGADSASSGSTKIYSHDLAREFSAVNAAGAAVTAFSQPLTITLAYPDANSDGRIDGDLIKESLAWIYYLDETSGKWTPVTGVTRDTAANTLSVPVSHFSVYSVRAVPDSGQGLGALKAYPNPCDLRKVSGLNIAGIPADPSPRVYIYNEAGELVRVLSPGDGIDTTGSSTAVSWNGKLKNGSKAASGLYLYLVKTANYGAGNGKFFIIW